MTRLEREQASIDARSLGRDAWERLCANQMARIGGGIFIGIALLCLIGPFFVPHSHETTQLAYGAQARHGHTGLAPTSSGATSLCEH